MNNRNYIFLSQGKFSGTRRFQVFEIAQPKKNWKEWLIRKKPIIYGNIIQAGKVFRVFFLGRELPGRPVSWDACLIFLAGILDDLHELSEGIPEKETPISSQETKQEERPFPDKRDVEGEGGGVLALGGADSTPSA